MTSEASPLLQALSAHQVRASVVDFDHYRIHGGISVETDYIISVHPDESPGDSFESFKLSKTYNAFRTLASQLKKIAEKACLEIDGTLPSDVAKCVKFAESVSHLVNSQSTAYLGKVNIQYVKLLAQQRTLIIDDTLETILQNYSTKVEGEHECLRFVSAAIETFFLTDHCEEEDEITSQSAAQSGFLTPSTKKPKKQGQGPLDTLGHGIKQVFSVSKRIVNFSEEASESEPLMSPVVAPMSRKTRRSVVLRAADMEQLEEDANLMVDGDDKYTKPAPPPYSPRRLVAKSGPVVNNPYVLPAIAAATLAVLRSVQGKTTEINADIALLIAFACYCLGLHTPRPSEVSPVVKKAAVKKAEPTVEPMNRRLLRKSMAATPVSQSMKAAWEVAAEFEEEEESLIESPMQTFPEGAELGSHFNCWQEPAFADFKVRGPTYLTDNIKVSSGPFVFPIRGIDLFLTDACPENIGSISGVMGGQLRDVPSFIINFRLPWGVLLFYAEIPKKLLPFLKACYDPFFDSAKLPSMDDLTPMERTAARFLMGDDDHKNGTLKIVPVVVKGPWVVKSVVGGKPAILGKKIPINYVYSPRDGNKAEYLEADLDIAASSAARSILSVCTSYTKSLTMDLGFVIQGNAKDELPEQMLTGARLHGIDPLNAPALPPMKNMFINNPPSLDDEDISQ